MLPWRAARSRGAPFLLLSGSHRRDTLLRCDVHMGAEQSLDEGLIKGLAHPLRWRLLETLTERGESSPVELARILGQPLATVSHHMRVLRDANCVELTRTEQRRGAIEHFYRALMPAFFDDEQWARVPATFRRGLAAQLFRRIVGEAATAGTEGAFDEPGSHMDRMFVELDDRGWEELSDLLTSILKQAQAIQDRSDTRRDAGDQARLSEIVVLHFKVPDTSAAAADGDPQSPRRSPPVP
jgi:DNA-binding transcriptional ArsR family regulator